MEFSRGKIFLDDLKKVRTSNMEEVSNVDFSYNLGTDLKIDVEASKQRKIDKEKKQEESRKEFERLKQKMEEKDSQPDLKKTVSKSEGPSPAYM